MTRDQQPSFAIGGREIGRDAPPFVIAEAGVNHNGDVALAHKLVEVSAQVGADAVKFQTFQAADVVHESAQTAGYQAEAGEGDRQLMMLKRLELPFGAWRELKSHADDLGLVFLSTAFDSASLGLLIELGVRALKIPSGELDNVSYLDAHAGAGLPLVVSTGMATLDEVSSACAVLDSVNAQYCLLHCVTSYPAPNESANLLAIPSMATAFGVPVGWSDHTEGMSTAIAATALGASVFEKHLTLDRGMSGPDHAASADPVEFAAYVRAVRETHVALGDGVKRPHRVELETRGLVRRSYYAARDLQAGTLLRSSDLATLRPVAGIPASRRIVGEQLRRAVSAGAPITADDLA